jgi:hypothetical protein
MVCPQRRICKRASLEREREFYNSSSSSTYSLARKPCYWALARLAYQYEVYGVCNTIPVDLRCFVTVIAYG